MTQGENNRIIIDKPTAEALALIELMTRRGFVAQANWGSDGAPQKGNRIFTIETAAFLNAAFLVRNFSEEVAFGGIPYKIIQILEDRFNAATWCSVEAIVTDNRLNEVGHANERNIGRILKRLVDLGLVEKRKSGKFYEYRVLKHTLRLMGIDAKMHEAPLAQTFAMMQVSAEPVAE